MKPRGLTEKQQRFVEAYCGPAKGNATEAARRAGYRGNDVTLATIGAQNVRKRQVAEAIEKLQAEARAKAVITRDEIFERLTSMARGQGTEPHVLQSGKVVETGPTLGTVRGALMDLAKLQGLLVDKLEVKAADAIGAQLRELQGKMSAGAFEELLVALSDDAEV